MKNQPSPLGDPEKGGGDIYDVFDKKRLPS